MEIDTNLASWCRIVERELSKSSVFAEFMEWRQVRRAAYLRLEFNIHIWLIIMMLIFCPSGVHIVGINVHSFKINEPKMISKVPLGLHHTFFEITTTDNFLGKNNVLRKRCFQKLGSQCASVTGWRPPKQRHKKQPFMQKPSPVLIMHIPSSKLIYLVLVIHHYWRPLAACLLILKFFRGWKVSGVFANQPQFLVYHFQWIQCLLTPKLFRSSGLFVNQLQFVYHFKYKWSDHNDQIANGTSVRHNFSL